MDKQKPTKPVPEKKQLPVFRKILANADGKISCQCKPGMRCKVECLIEL